MRIDIYKSLADKDPHFNSKTIDDKSALDALITRWSQKDDSKNLIFRGVIDAKYKLYNSGQRAWLSQELNKLGKSYNNFIQTEIDKAKAYQNNLLVKFYNAFGHPAYDLSILSFLQHYGAPTPLLDWTYNFDNSLFFASDGLKHYPSEDIDNYFSIYAIDTNWNGFISITEFINNSLEGLDKAFRTFPGSDYTDIENQFSSLKYDFFSGLQMFYVPGYVSGSLPFPIPSRLNFVLVYNQHNLNIINQEGLFVFNSDDTIPLEDYFKGLDSSSKDDKFRLPKIYCWNIHKSLSEYIIRYLNEKTPIPINKEFIYPQEEAIALNSFIEFKNFR